MSVLFDINPGKTRSIVCPLEMSVVSNACKSVFGSNSLKVSVIIDMNSQNAFTLVW